MDTDGTRLDDSLIVRFDEGASFTGDAMAEIHCHGSRAVIAAISGRLSDEAGCRLARPGEFSRRAWEDGRIDLAEAEGLADLIAAETEMQRRQAVRIMAGALSEKVELWRGAILHACALIEVSIDWVDEDVPEDVKPEVRQILKTLMAELQAELARSRSSQRLRSGFEVAILGAPNVGKSTLLNYLAGRDASIVSKIPGTTRDVIEVRFDLQGMPVTFLDTAGIRAVEDEVELIGIQRAIERAGNADLRLFLQTQDGPIGSVDVDQRNGDIVAWSKSDLGVGGPGPAFSAQTGEGIDRLLADIFDRLSNGLADNGLMAHLRHEEAATMCHRLLDETLTTIDEDPLEIIAERLRLAAGYLERIVGRIDAEAVLDRVFSAFCLGK